MHARRERWAVAAMAAAGLAALAVLFAPRQEGRRPPAVQPSAQTPVATAPQPIAAPARMNAARPQHAATPVRSLRPTADAPGQTEICGYGRVQLPPDDPYAMQRIAPALRLALLDQAEALMLASADERLQAAALFIAGQRREQLSAAGNERLVRLASVSHDPLVYGMALQACQAAPEAGPCRLLSRAQWARLDADNALPWLDLAAEAQRQGDAAAEAQAMHRAALARRCESYRDQLPALVERALDAQGATPLQRTLALAASWSAQAAWVPAHTAQAFAWCAPELLADANRRLVCDAMADTLVRHGRSLADLDTGLSLGRALGWPDARLAALQQEQDAIHEAGIAPPDALDFSCEGVERVQAWMRRLGAAGELRALRERLAHNGRSVAALSERHRSNLALASDAAASAAVALGMP